MRKQKQIDGWVQDCSNHAGNSSALAMELLQSCAKPSIWNATMFRGTMWMVLKNVPWSTKTFAKFFISHTNIEESYLFWYWLSLVRSGPWFNIKMSSYQHRKSHCGDKTILRPSYLHNGISYTGKTTSFNRTRPLQTKWWPRWNIRGRSYRLRV